MKVEVPVALTGLILLAALAFYAIPLSAVLKVGFPASDSELAKNRILPETGAEYNDFSRILRIKTLRPDLDYPLVFSPVSGGMMTVVPDCVEGLSTARDVEASSVAALECFIKQNQEWLSKLYYKHGALLFRGFAVNTAKDFETIASNLVYPAKLFDGTYLGTSPRLKGYNNTGKVYTASEIPSNQVIPVHLEMSFRRNMPPRIIFWAELPNTSPGGETPLSDFRQVWRDFRPDVAARFKENGVKYSRRYFSDQKGGIDSLRPWTWHYSFTKSWEAMFNTQNKSEAEELAKAQGFEVKWVYGDADIMELSHTMNATRIHPVTSDEIWSNHLAVLHADSWSAEYAAAAHRTTSLWMKAHLVFSYFRMKLFKIAMMFGLGGGPEVLGTHVTHANGQEISDEDMAHFRAVVARNTVTERWQKYDIMYLDNHRVSHGRHSFYGPRKILTTWTE